MKLNDDAYSKDSGKQAQGEVRVQHRAGPPLEEENVGTMYGDKPKSPDQARNPIPVNAVEPFHPRIESQVRQILSHPPAAGIQEAWEQLAHRQNGHPMVVGKDIGEAGRVFADSAQESGAGAHHAHAQWRRVDVEWLDGSIGFLAHRNTVPCGSISSPVDLTVEGIPPPTLP